MATLKDLAALAASFTQPEPVAPTLPKGWRLVGERNGKPHYRTAPAVAVPKPRNNPVRKAFKRLNLQQTVPALTPGMTCPRCRGAGIVQWGNCFWCNDPTTRGVGKGVLNSRDIQLITARLRGAGPICDVVVA